MKRIRGLSNERYQERKEAITRILKLTYEGEAVDPLPPSWFDMLDRMAPK